MLIASSSGIKNPNYDIQVDDSVVFHKGKLPSLRRNKSANTHVGERPQTPRPHVR